MREQLESAFEQRGVLRGGILLLRPGDAVALTEAAKQKGIRVLGIDAFRLGSGTTQPLMEHSVDLSVESGMVDCWAKASEFIRKQPVDLVFEVVLE